MTTNPIIAERIRAAGERARAEAGARRQAGEQAAGKAGGGAQSLPPELGGQPGPEPTRYGDWEKKGVISDF